MFETGRWSAASASARERVPRYSIEGTMQSHKTESAYKSLVRIRGSGSRLPTNPKMLVIVIGPCTGPVAPLERIHSVAMACHAFEKNGAEGLNN